MAKGLETYLEYSVKYDRNGNQVVKQDGTPELLELLQECRLDQLSVKILNDNWRGFNKFYVKKEKEAVAVKMAIVAGNATETKETVAADGSVDSEEELDIWNKTEAEVDEMFAKSSKAKMLAMYGLPCEKNKINLITVPMAKEMVNSAIKAKKGE